MPYGFDVRVPLYRYRPDLPEWLDVVLETALQSVPNQRYQDIGEVSVDIER
ncbi:hypothetical protein VSR34_22255 [Paraburkholderia sp. JHI2823]|uniref:hypothetical protein n=1 Tax=Paraburkholderia sp. JHI2823 TaxID=3112960 RepID=UPI0031715413